MPPAGLGNASCRAFESGGASTWCYFPNVCSSASGKALLEQVQEPRVCVLLRTGRGPLLRCLNSPASLLIRAERWGTLSGVALIGA
jgi:hypothetical protein